MEKDFIQFKKNGKFYNVYDNDAYIISYLLHYKMVNGRVGFPINSINKVTNILEDKKISYKLDEEYKNYKDLNKYSMVLEYSKSVVNIIARYNFLEDHLKDLNIEQLNRILSFIEEVINE